MLPNLASVADDICLIKSGHNVLNGPLDEIRARFTTPTYLLKGRGLEALGALPTVAEVHEASGLTRVTLAEGVSTREFLTSAAEHAEIISFRPDEPDLESIYVQAVADAPE